MRIFFMLLAVSLSFAVHAQQIRGIVKDADGKLLNKATIGLLKDTGNAVLKFTVTGDNGTYVFENINPGKYRVSASYVGFVPSVSDVFEFDGSNSTRPELKLAKASGQMSNVTVVGSKPIIEVKADKTILNVEGTVNSVGSDALELLRKSPGVMVDKDENLSVNGKNGVQVYIDGRATPLSGQDLANYLKAIQSSNIESIEIITNPSAKYEAAGNAGIINIRLKKNKSFGTNGSVNAGANFGYYPKYNTGITLNHRNKSINLYGNYGFDKGTNRNDISLYRTVLDTLFDQHGSMKTKDEDQNFKAGLDYFINKQSTIGVMANGNISNGNVSNYSRTPISYMPTKTVDRILVADNSSATHRKNVNLNLNYSYNAADGKNLTLNADHGYYNIYSNQYQPNYYYNASGNTINDSVVYRMISPTKIYISSFKADWEQNFAKGKLGFGGKASYVKTNNDFQRYDVYNSNQFLDKDHSNLFNYKENINAGYVNYNRQFKAVMIQAGLRVENTVSKGTSHGEKDYGNGYVKEVSEFRRNYTDFFPSAAITFNKNPMSQLGFSYSRRIDRPAYQDLNPFEFKLDEYTYMKGNVNLRPQYTNSFGFSHTYKYRLNTSVNYSHVKDIFTFLIDTIEKSKGIVSKKNLATQNIISLNISYPFQYKSYSVFASLGSNYSMYRADFGSGRKINLNAFGLTFFAQNSLKLDKAKKWTAELTGFYSSPTVWQGAFKSKTLWSVDAGLSRQLWNNKATVKTSFSDIFNSLRFKGTQTFAGQTSKVGFRWESQQFKLNFVYRFGSSQIKAARNRKTGSEEENKRTQGGAGFTIGQ